MLVTFVRKPTGNWQKVTHIGCDSVFIAIFATHSQLLINKKTL